MIGRRLERVPEDALLGDNGGAHAVGGRLRDGVGVQRGADVVENGSVAGLLTLPRAGPLASRKRWTRVRVLSTAVWVDCNVSPCVSGALGVGRGALDVRGGGSEVIERGGGAIE